jgi:hypothetical protein
MGQVSNPGWGDWVRIVHDDDPEKPEEPFRDLSGRCGEYERYDDRPGVPRPHRVALEPGAPGGGLVYVFAVEVVTPCTQIRDAEARVAEAKEAVIAAARAQHAASEEWVAVGGWKAAAERMLAAEDAVDDAVGHLIECERALAALRPAQAAAAVARAT